MVSNRTWQRWGLALFVWLVPATGLLAAEQEAPVRFGVFPYVSPVQLVKFHNTLRVYLEEVLGRRVILVTAPSFPEFIVRTRKAQYDYVLTAPHLGRLAQYRDGYHPLVKTGHLVRGIYLVPKDSPLKTLSDLEGKSIMMVGEAAVLTQLAVRQLRELGLEDGVNLEIRRTRTQNNAMYASLRGDADVSVTGELLFQKIQKRNQDKVRVIGRTPAVPGFIMLAAPQVPAAERDKVRAALLHFNERKESIGYFRATGFKALLPVDESEMEDLQPFIERWLRKP